MRFPRLLHGFHPRDSEADDLYRLRAALDRAKIQYSAAAPELALSSLPATPPPVRRMLVEPEAFRFPLPGPVRVAMLEGRFRPERNVREFREQDIAWLHFYAPEALVVPAGLALDLADRRRRGLLLLPELKVAVVVLTSLAPPPLSLCDRELLWRAFGVPVFEQLRGWDGAIIARECEVHDGLHIDETSAILQMHEGELLVTQLRVPGEPILRARTGLTGEILPGFCECGAETPRLRNLAALPSQAAIAAA